MYSHVETKVQSHEHQMFSPQTLTRMRSISEKKIQLDSEQRTNFVLHGYQNVRNIFRVHQAYGIIIISRGFWHSGAQGVQPGSSASLSKPQKIGVKMLPKSLHQKRVRPCFMFKCNPTTKPASTAQNPFEYTNNIYLIGNIKIEIARVRRSTIHEMHLLPLLLRRCPCFGRYGTFFGF